MGYPLVDMSHPSNSKRQISVFINEINYLLLTGIRAASTISLICRNMLVSPPPTDKNLTDRRFLLNDQLRGEVGGFFVGV